MKIGEKYSFRFIMLWLILTLAVIACYKEDTLYKLSAKSCLVNQDMIISAIICEGKQTLFTVERKNIQLSTGFYETYQLDIRKTLNPNNGTWSESEIKYRPELPKNTTLGFGIFQLEPNGGSFILRSNYTYYDSSKNPVKYIKLVLTDKNLMPLNEFKLLDSLMDVDDVKLMKDGRYVVIGSQNNKKLISCYKSDLTLDWIRTAESGANSADYQNGALLVTDEFIYLAQLSRYYTNNYRVFQYDYIGRRLSTYEIGGLTNKYTAGDIIGSSDGYYIIGTKYFPEKSSHDISISTMKNSNTLLSEHSLNITDYIPDWNTTIKNVYETYYSTGTTYMKKAMDGYAFAFDYPDNRNNNSLAMVKLDQQMKVEWVKVIAKSTHDGYKPIISIDLFTDGSRYYILWRRKQDDKCFYVLDKEGNLIND